MVSVAQFKIGHEQTQLNRICNMHFLFVGAFLTNSGSNFAEVFYFESVLITYMNMGVLALCVSGLMSNQTRLQKKG